MKVLILENRYKTYFWDAIAQHLIDHGHDVTWIVQNPSFMPEHGRVSVLGFPRGTDLAAPDDSQSLDKVRASDRHINYFGGHSAHYAYYKDMIWRALEAAAPELVIGEATLFHELMAAEWCRLHQVSYFHPSMPGYPSGRFSIYLHDSKNAVPGAADIPSDEDCWSLAEAIRKRESIPDYMKPALFNGQDRLHSPHGSLSNKVKLMLSYYRGERFNTPSPLRKLLLDGVVKRNLASWSTVASSKYSLQKDWRYVLYPMQMQPESNIDLWGQAYRDQVGLIRRIATVLPAGWKLLVKLNPKAKYELTQPLLELIATDDRIMPVPFNTAMATVFDAASLVCTVTGTVAVEAILSRKPMVQFGPGILSDETGYTQLTDVDGVAGVIAQIEDGSFQLASDSERIALVKKLYYYSYPGTISDPATSPAVLQAENVKVVADNLMKVAQSCVQKI